MTIDQLRNVHRAQPFRPFTLRMADGSALHVGHPEWLTFSPAGRTVIVFKPDDSFSIIDLLLVASIDVGNGESGKPSTQAGRDES